ncbi:MULTISPECIES: hypothetical protein [Clostridioides]|uniref:hypothetical protein n=1 Tax=Clostridioides sp. ZZV14-6387 TaxID=2811497 RepID=UPI0007BB3561|nr:hypothetical protein [Clostridioides sp. ZZV14-6387]CZR99322.1 hypothetical protein CDFC105_64148 [Clostridioides difficile]CZS08840.1 hypothetical protein CDFC105_72928 [Clostridioides difficile]
MNENFANDFNRKEKENFIKDASLLYETDYLEFIKIKYLLKGIAKEKRKQLLKKEKNDKSSV